MLEGLRAEVNVKPELKANPVSPLAAARVQYSVLGAAGTQHRKLAPGLKLGHTQMMP